MRKYTVCVGILAIVVYCLSMMGATSDENTSEPQASIREPARLLMALRHDREQALDKIVKEYTSDIQKIEDVLSEAIKKHGKDRSFHSPLHCAIELVQMLRVREAEQAIFSVVDYSVDPTTIPMGWEYENGYLYPAASTLEFLRVDIDHVIEAIRLADSQRKLACLAWVLSERSGTVEQARLFLENARKKWPDDEKIKQVIRLFEHSSIELPPLPE